MQNVFQTPPLQVLVKVEQIFYGGNFWVVVNDQRVGVFPGILFKRWRDSDVEQFCRAFVQQANSHAIVTFESHDWTERLNATLQDTTFEGVDDRVLDMVLDARRRAAPAKSADQNDAVCSVVVITEDGSIRDVVLFPNDADRYIARDYTLACLAHELRVVRSCDQQADMEHLQFALRLQSTFDFTIHSFNLPFLASAGSRVRRFKFIDTMDEVTAEGAMFPNGAVALVWIASSEGQSSRPLRVFESLTTAQAEVSLQQSHVVWCDPAPTTLS